MHRIITEIGGATRRSFARSVQEPWRAWRLFVPVIVVAALVVFPIPVGLAAATSCTPITGPTTITSAGCYELGGDVADSGAPVYIEVRASDVVIDGQGHTLDGSDTAGTTGILVGGGTPVSNVTLRNISLTDWGVGVSLVSASDSRVLDLTASSNDDVGVVIADGTNLTVAGVAADTNDAYGVHVARSVTDVVIQNTTATENTVAGILIDNATGASLHNVTVFSTDTSTPFTFGVALSDTPGTVVDDLSVTGMEVGLLVDSRSSNATVTDFDIAESQIGARIEAGGTIARDGYLDGTGYGVDVDTTDAVTLDNLTVVDTIGTAVDVTAADARLTNNSVLRANGGIHVSRSDVVSLLDNNVTLANGDGIQLQYVTAAYLEGNAVWYNARHGIGIQYPLGETRIAATDAHQNGEAGISVEGTDFVPGPAGVVVWNNTLRTNTNGISLHNIDGVTIRDNVARSNSEFGVTLVQSRNTTVAANSLRTNYDGGLEVGVGSNNTTVTRNEIVENAALGIEAIADAGRITANRLDANGGSTGVGILIGRGPSSPAPAGILTTWLIANNTLTGHGEIGITLDDLVNVTLVDNEVLESHTGVRVTDTTGVVAEDNRVIEGENGLVFDDVTAATVRWTNATGNTGTAILLADVRNTTLENATASASGQWALYAIGESDETTVSGLRIGQSTASTTVDLDAFRNVGLAAVTAPPPDPAGHRNVSHFVRVVNTSEGRNPAPSVDATMTAHVSVRYATADLGGLDESTLELQRYDGTWSVVSDSAVDTGSNVVSGTVSATGIVAPLALASTTLEVEIDLKPGNRDQVDPINPRSGGLIPVGIFSTPTVDVTAIDVDSLRLGSPSVVTAGGGAQATHGGHLDDIDGDGDEDLVVHVETRAAGFEPGVREAVLVGKTQQGTDIHGTDTVRIVGGNGRGPR